MCFLAGIHTSTAHRKPELTYNVEKDFVLPVLDALRAPTDGVGDGHGRSRGDIQLVTFLRDELLKNLTVCRDRKKIVRIRFEDGCACGRVHRLSAR